MLMAKQNNTVEHAEYAEEDDVAIVTQLLPCCRPSATSSTVITVVSCDELDEDSCSNDSGIDSGESESTIYFQKSSQRPALTRHLMWKRCPMDIHGPDNICRHISAPHGVPMGRKFLGHRVAFTGTHVNKMNKELGMSTTPKQRSALVQMVGARK